MLQNNKTIALLVVELTVTQSNHAFFTFSSVLACSNFLTSDVEDNDDDDDGSVKWCFSLACKINTQWVLGLLPWHLCKFGRAHNFTKERGPLTNEGLRDQNAY